MPMPQADRMPASGCSSDVAHAERARQRADVLAAGAAEADQRAAARVDTARGRHLRDRLGHAGVRDRDEARRDLVEAALEALRAQRRLQRGERARRPARARAETGSDRAARGRARGSRR